MEKIVEGMSTYLEKIEGINLDKQKLVFLMFSVPPVCNYRCKKCFNSIDAKKAEGLLTLKEVFRIIKEAKEMGAKNVSILGEGEPLLYGNIKDVAKYTHELGMSLIIATNGSLLTKEMTDYLFRYNTIIGISLDTLNEKEYNEYCGGSANLKEVLKNITYARKLYSAKISEIKNYRIYRLMIHMTVTAKNFKEMKAIEDFCKDDIYFDCQTLSEVGNAKKNASFFKDKKYDYNTFKKLGHLIKPPMVLMKMKNGKNICSLFQYGLSVSSNGDVILDAGLKETIKFIGNIRDSSLKNLIKRRNKLRDFYLKNYNLLGYCPIREQTTMKKFIKDLKEFKYKA